MEDKAESPFFKSVGMQWEARQEAHNQPGLPRTAQRPKLHRAVGFSARRAAACLSSMRRRNSATNAPQTSPLIPENPRHNLALPQHAGLKLLALCHH